MKISDAIVKACRQALASAMADGAVVKIYLNMLPGLIPSARIDRWPVPSGSLSERYFLMSSYLT